MNTHTIHTTSTALCLVSSPSCAEAEKIVEATAKKINQDLLQEYPELAQARYSLSFDIDTSVYTPFGCIVVVDIEEDYSQDFIDGQEKAAKQQGELGLAEILSSYLTSFSWEEKELANATFGILHYSKPICIVTTKVSV